MRGRYGFQALIIGDGTRKHCLRDSLPQNGSCPEGAVTIVGSMSIPGGRLAKWTLLDPTFQIVLNCL